MERFTFSLNDINAVNCDDAYEARGDVCLGSAIDRLSAYEDTGLEPEEYVDSIGKLTISVLMKRIVGRM